MPTPLFANALSPEALKAAVHSYLTTDVEVPEGHNGAVVVVVNLDKVETVVATKLADNWSLNVVASHAWSGENQFSVLSKTTW